MNFSGGLLGIALLLTGCLSRPSLRTEHPRSFSSSELLDRAEASEREGDSVRAEQYAVAAVAKGASDEHATRLLVRVCLAADRPRSALRYAAAFLERHPRDAALRYVVAVTQQALGDDSAALTSAEALTSDHPSFAPAFYLLALARREQGDTEGARAAFSTLLLLDPASSHAAEARSFVAGRNRATPSELLPKRGTEQDDPRRRLPPDVVRGSRAVEAAAR